MKEGRKEGCEYSLSRTADGGEPMSGERGRRKAGNGEEEGRKRYHNILKGHIRPTCGEGAR
jgi:hypothetical protein